MSEESECGPNSACVFRKKGNIFLPKRNEVRYNGRCGDWDTGEVSVTAKCKKAVAKRIKLELNEEARAK